MHKLNKLRDSFDLRLVTYRRTGTRGKRIRSKVKKSIQVGINVGSYLVIVPRALAMFEVWSIVMWRLVLRCISWLYSNWETGGGAT